MIDRFTVERVAHLARLGLTDEELQSLETQLSRILDYVDLIAASQASEGDVSTSPLPPLRLRADVAVPSLEHGQALANAPEAESGYVRVPPVLD